MTSYRYIDSDAELTAYRRSLQDRGVSVIALDIEGEFNLHVYGERFCLLQLFDGKEEVVVDPLGISTDSLKALFENRDLLKIIYDSASDRLLLAKTHGILMNSILDLRPAAELLEFPKKDLKSVLQDSLGLEEGGSKKRYQHYNWTLRPIDPGAIEYAIQDVRHLFALKDVLLEKLANNKLLDTYILENLKRQDQEPDVNRQPGILRSGRFKRLSATQQQEFQRLYDIRDRYARQLDLPPNTVVANNDLFSLVAGKLSAESLRGNRRIPDPVLRAIKEEFLNDEASA
mgnify:FL=1